MTKISSNYINIGSQCVEVENCIPNLQCNGTQTQLWSPTPEELRETLDAGGYNYKVTSRCILDDGEELELREWWIDGDQADAFTDLIIAKNANDQIDPEQAARAEVVNRLTWMSQHKMMATICGINFNVIDWCPYELDNDECIYLIDVPHDLAGGGEIRKGCGIGTDGHFYNFSWNTSELLDYEDWDGEFPAPTEVYRWPNTFLIDSSDKTPQQYPLNFAVELWHMVDAQDGIS